MDVLAKCFAFDELHSDERPVTLLADIVNRADSRMVESGGGLGFAAKAFQGLHVLRHVLGKKFQGHRAVQAGVHGFVHHTHSPGAKFFDDAEVGDGLFNHRRIRGSRSSDASHSVWSFMAAPSSTLRRTS